MKTFTTKMSSRGQVVIPKDLRRDLEEGTSFIVLRSGTKILLKKIPIDKTWDEMMEENRKIVKRTGLKESEVPKIIQRFRKERRKKLSQLV